jgi:hypothetical protein
VHMDVYCPILFFYLIGWQMASDRSSRISSRAPISSQLTSGIVANPSRLADGCTFVTATCVSRTLSGDILVQIKQKAFFEHRYVLVQIKQKVFFEGRERERSPSRCISLLYIGLPQSHPW